MSEITLKIEVSELTAAILVLAEAVRGGQAAPLNTASGITPAPAPVASSPIEASTSVPVMANPMPAAPPIPETPASAVAAVPTQAPTYGPQQLAVAATQLVDAGRIGEVQGLLAKYGANSILALPKEQYGAFATDLRALGVKI